MAANSSLTISPILFDGSQKSTTITVTNNEKQTVAYKFKTNAPEKYLVKPVSGKIEASKTINVQIQKTQPDPPVKADQFLLQFIILSDNESAEFTPENWKSYPQTRIQKVILPCKPSTHKQKVEEEAGVSLATLQTEQLALKEKILQLERLSRETKKKSGIGSISFTRSQLIFLAGLCLFIGLVAPYFSKKVQPV